jgi:hypothetical protein
VARHPIRKTTLTDLGAFRGPRITPRIAWVLALLWLIVGLTSTAVGQWAPLKAARQQFKILYNQGKYADLSTSKPITLATTQALLAKDGALLAYVVWNKSAFTCVV